MSVSTYTSESGIALFERLFSQTTSTGKQRSTVSSMARSISFNLRDSFTSTPDAVMRRTVAKMQSAINVSLSDVLGQNSQFSAKMQSVQQSSTLLMSTNGLIRLDSSNANQQLQLLTPEKITRGITAAGGREAIEPWVINGWTKLDVDGVRSVANVNGAGGSYTATQAANTEQALAESIDRFGFTMEDLQKDGAATMREKLKASAANIQSQSPELSAMVEFALEDAFSKLSAWENRDARSDSPSTDWSEQTNTNLQQAGELARQLNLGSNDTWGVESLAHDLAVFGLDLTALNNDPTTLIADIKDRSIALLKDLDSSHVGTESNLETLRRQITGASARLVNGLQGSAGSFISANMSVSSSVSGSVSASVGGVNVNASAIIAVGNVVVDPLVLDLKGDGIDLKSAEDGVMFDMNGDGQKTRMGFIKGDDALLFVDEYGDGLVRDGKQLFGNADGYSNGFEKLRSYDDNGDGVIDENDAIWDSLRLWVEKTEDGVCEEGETISLSEAGVKSINVGYENVREDDGKGNLIGQVGSFERTDGTVGLAADAWLQELRNSTM